MKNVPTSVRLRDVLYEFALAKQVPDAELLDEFVQRYPEHAAVLTEFAIELAGEAADDQVKEPVVEQAKTLAVDEISPAVSKAISRFHNRLHAVRQAEADDQRTSAAPANPFAALDRAAFRALARRLNANTVFVAKLRDRHIHPRTISQGFQQRLAEELGVPTEVIAAHCAAQPQIQARTHFKADQKPEAVGKQTFEEAVRSSGLSEEQQRYLLSL